MLISVPLRQPRATGWHVITDVQDLRSLRGSWDRLAADGGMPTARFAWALACAESFHPDGALRVVAVVREGQLVAVAPLGPGTRPDELEPLGMRELYEPSDFLYADDEALDALVCALRRLGQPVCIRRLSADSPTLVAVAQAYAGRGLVACRPADGTPTLVLDDAWMQPEGALPARRRSDLRRARRRAEAMGEVSFDLLSPTVHDLARPLEEALAVEAAGWKGSAGSALEQDMARLRFIRRYAYETAANGQLRLGMMRIDGVAVAMQVAVEMDNRLWLLKIGYDERFARCSPGSLLLLESLRASAARGLAACEFLGSVSDWTSVWTQQERSLVAMRAYPARPRGIVRLGLDVGHAARRRLVAHAAASA